MRLNIPDIPALEAARSVLIAGAGGGFDVFAGLPLYFTLREQGKRVHLANYSFSEFTLARLVSRVEVLIEDMLLAARGAVRHQLPYYPEGYLAQWFAARDEDVPVWMFKRTGVVPLRAAYQRLVEHLEIDSLILVDGGVDSIMRGDELGPGTLVEDSISLAAVEQLELPCKLLACVGFGTEVEELLCHHHALENMAALAKEGALRGSCLLTAQMPVFQQYEAACRYVWEQPGHAKSHISTRIIPAVHGEFGDHRLYAEQSRAQIMLSPLMSLYWFFDADAVTARNLLVPYIRESGTAEFAVQACLTLRETLKLRPRQPIPY
jgi:hypothetical protein